MQYLLLLTFPPGTGPQEGTPEFDAEMKVWGEYMDELRKSGVYLGASGLTEGVTPVRALGGDVIVTDGPYAETKEILFSFYILDVEDLDAAIAWARKMPSVEYGSVEIRPMVHHQFS